MFVNDVVVCKQPPMTLVEYIVWHMFSSYATSRQKGKETKAYVEMGMSYVVSPDELSHLFHVFLHLHILVIICELQQSQCYKGCDILRTTRYGTFLCGKIFREPSGKSTFYKFTNFVFKEIIHIMTFTVSIIFICFVLFIEYSSGFAYSFK